MYIYISPIIILFLLLILLLIESLLFNLNTYYDDRIMNDIKKINPDFYNNKWQELIDSLLQPDYKKRFDINQVLNFLENRLNNNHKNNKIIGEIYIKKRNI